MKNKLQARFDLFILALILLLVFLSFPAKTTNAQTMSNSQYIIQMGNLNNISGLATGSNYRVTFTSGQTASGLYNNVTGANFRIRGGFQYIMSIIPFSFKVDNVFIDFGTIYAGTAVYRSNNVTVSTNSSQGYSVTVSENHQLMIPSRGVMIPDTACDGPSCDTGTAKVWTLPGTYGFGYNCQDVSGTNCSGDFLGSTYYRPFIASPSAVTVMSGAIAGRNKKSQITYKVNVSGTQASGLYTNIINFIATPTY